MIKFTLNQFRGSLVLVAAMFASVQLFAQSPAEVLGTVSNPLGTEYQQLAKVTAQQGRVVMYRPAGTNPGAASVFVNGAYQTSLQPGAFSQLCIAPSQIFLGVRLVENGRDVRKDFDSTEQVQVPGGKNVYIRVVDQDNGTAALAEVSETRALEELKGSRQQIHTLSRVRNAVACEVDLEPPKPVLVALEKDIQLSADSLFAFGKSDLQSMLPEGRNALKTLADRISTTYKTQDRLVIQVVGHADPFSRVGEAINTRLSLERAQTVGDYFASSGFRPAQLIIDGKGSAQPIVTTCGTERTQANFDCNKPNRRVVVTVATKTN